MNILRIEDVVKTYDKHIAVNHVSFDMPEDCIFGMLGPNGAGKSSLIRMITTITRPDSGKIFFANEPLNSRHPEQIGYMPEERGLYKRMKIGEHMLYLAQLKGLSYNDARTEVRKWFIKLDITDWWDKKVEELSKGMQQKVQFVSTVIHKPRLLMLRKSPTIPTCCRISPSSKRCRRGRCTRSSRRRLIPTTMRPSSI